MIDKPAATWSLVVGLLLAAVVSCGQRRVFANAESKYNAGHYAEAVDAFTPIASGSGQLAEQAQLYVGFCHFKMGQHDQAVRSFEALSERFPESEWADDAWYWVARCYEDWGRTPEAIVAYEKALETIPPSGKANMALRAREAIDILEAAAPAVPGDTGGAERDALQE